MAARKRAAKPTEKRVAKPEPARSLTGSSQTDPAVVAFLRKLDHPLKREIESVRQIVLGVSPEIREGIKWNSPSFRTKDYFATLNLRAKDGQDRVWSRGRITPLPRPSPRRERRPLRARARRALASTVRRMNLAGR